MITRYDDVKALAADWQRFSNVTGQFEVSREGVAGKEEIMRMYQEAGYRPDPALIASDPPQHRLHRAAVNTAFSIPGVRAMERDITEVTDGLIDRFQSRGLGK